MHDYRSARCSDPIILLVGMYPTYLSSESVRLFFSGISYKSLTCYSYEIETKISRRQLWTAIQSAFRKKYNKGSRSTFERYLKDGIHACGIVSAGTYVGFRSESTT